MRPPPKHRRPGSPACFTSWAAALCCMMLAGCHRKPAAEAAGATEMPASPVPTAETSWLAPLAPVFAAKGPVPGQNLTAEQVRKREAIFAEYGPPRTAAAAIQQAVRLQQEYQLDKEYLSRVEVIYRLADASTPQSREALTRLFFTEPDVDLRVAMVNALPFVDDGDIVQSLPILQEALKAGQPRELREAGLDTIQALNDPRTLPLLHAALNDPDPELRETAARTREYFEEVRQLGVP